MRKLVKNTDLWLAERCECDVKEMSTQQKRREYSTNSVDGQRERIPSDDLYYQGVLKAVEGRKGT